VRLVDGYIRNALGWGFLLVLLVLMAVFSFLDFVEELEETGQGHYGALQALAYVLQTSPARAIELVPVSALLGCLLGLGMLERTSELVAMRALGISARRIQAAIFKAALILLVLVAVMGEWIAPQLAQHAWRQRALAIAGDVMRGTEQGDSFWYRDRQRFININDMRYGRVPLDIDIFELEQDGSLATHIHAASAERLGQGRWRLLDVRRSRIGAGGWPREHLPALEWEGFLSPREGAVTELETESLAPSALYRYARDLAARGQNAERYELALWRKLSVPLATLAMVLLAVPLVLGRLRLINVGQRLMIGAGVGVAFYLGDQIVQQLGLLAEAEPRLVAVAPAAFMLALGLALNLRVR